MNERGRSMIEMLGVLAIVGILSMAGIAGFSKAMMKYKLNKQTEQVVSILNYTRLNVQKLFRSFRAKNENITAILKTLGTFPDEMIRQNKPNSVYDVFGNSAYIQMLKYEGGRQYFELIFYLKHKPVESCMNFVLLGKQYGENLWRVKFTNEQYSFWGDAYCRENVSCLKDVTITEIVETCKACKGGCYFWFQEQF